MSRTANKPLTASQKRQIASEMHVWILDGLAQKTPWSLEDIKFQGGTSLALAWDSPRFSEDLDFVARADLNFVEAIKKIVKHVEQGLQKNFPDISVEVKNNQDKENQNLTFVFVASLPNVLGKVKVKSEFWKVDGEIVKSYDGTYKALARRGDINPSFGVATPEQIFADKMIALGGRDRLKWRDLFDLWYLDSAGITQKIISNRDDFSSRIENTLSLYNLSPSELRNKWDVLFQKNNEEIVAMAEQDLKPWISDQLWSRLYPHEVRKMVEGMKEKLSVAMEIFPPEEYKGLDAPTFQKIISTKRAVKQKEDEMKMNIKKDGYEK